MLRSLLVSKLHGSFIAEWCLKNNDKCLNAIGISVQWVFYLPVSMHLSVHCEFLVSNLSPSFIFFFFYFKYFTRSGRPLEGCESLGYSPRNRSSNLELSRTLAFWHVEFLLCLLNAWQKNKREKKKQLYFSFGFPQDFDFISSLALAIFYCNLSVYMSVLSPRLCTPWRQAVSLRHSFSWAPSTC